MRTLPKPHSFAFVAAVSGVMVVILVIAIIWLMDVPCLGARQNYFPPAVDTRFSRGWADRWAPHLASELEAAGEEPWFRGPRLQAYRFTWERAFEPLLIVRVERTSGGARVTWHEEVRGEQQLAFHSGSRDMPVEAWTRVEAAFAAAKFWNDPPTQRESAGADGSEWLVEGVRNGRYQIWTAWSPGMRGGSLRVVADAALELVRVADRMPELRRTY